MRELNIKNKGVLSLIGEIVCQSAKHKIGLEFHPTEQVPHEVGMCSGYFDEKSLVVAYGKERFRDWFDILVHESCHLDQMVGKSPHWHPDKVALDIVHDWIDGKEERPAKGYPAFVNSLDCEIDCEKRVIRKIKKHKIPFDFDDYIRKANAYLYGYGVSYHARFWPSRPYENRDLCKRMPHTFLKPADYLNVPELLMVYYNP